MALAHIRNARLTGLKGVFTQFMKYTVGIKGKNILVFGSVTELATLLEHTQIG